MTSPADQGQAEENSEAASKEAQTVLLDVSYREYYGKIFKERQMNVTGKIITKGRKMRLCCCCSSLVALLISLVLTTTHVVASERYETAAKKSFKG